MMFVLGGYQRDQGFLDSVEQYKNGSWQIRDDMTMSVKKSHFCSVYVKVFLFVNLKWVCLEKLQDRVLAWTKRRKLLMPN